MTYKTRATRISVAAVTFLAVTACEDSTGAGSERRLTVASGGEQVQPAGAELAAPIVVILSDGDGRAVAGEPVRFAVVSGGGSVTPTEAVTDAAGQAAVRWTLGTAAADSQRLEVRATDGTRVRATTRIRATATAGAPVQAQHAGGDGQAGTPGQPLTDSLAVRVVDAFGNPVQGVQVRWSVVSGGGAVSAALTTTRVDGIAKTRWSLGGGSPSVVVARAEGLAGDQGIARFTASGGGTIVLRVSSPYFTDASVQVGDTVYVRVQVTSPVQVAAVTARLLDREVTLVPVPFGELEGKIPTAGIPYGPAELSVTARDVNGLFNSVIVPVVVDRFPVLTVFEPADSTVVGTATRVRATCTDDDPAGCEIRVSMSGGLLVSATGSLDATVPLSAHDGRVVQLLFQAVGKSRPGATEVVQPRTVAVNSAAGGWTRVAEVPGRVVDVRGTRVLYQAGTSLRIRDASTGGDTEILAGMASNVVVLGYLHAGGAFFMLVERDTNAGPVYDWRSGALASLGRSFSQETFSVVGNWSVYRDGLTLHRRDLDTGADVALGTQGLSSAGVGPNGDVVEVVDLGAAGRKLLRYRAGASVELASYPFGTSLGKPNTDGMQVVYPIFGGNALNEISHVFFTTDGASQTELGVANRWVRPGAHYDVAGGWMAFPRTDAVGNLQLWTRSPAGEVRQVGSFGTSSTLAGLGPAGQVVLLNEETLYLSTPPYTAALTRLGAGARAFWRDGRLFLAFGRSVFEVTSVASLAPYVARHHD